MPHPLARRLLLLAAFGPLELGLAGCASFSPDSGISAVSELTNQTIHKDVAFVRSPEGAEAAGATVRRLLSRPLGVAADVRRAYVRAVAANEMAALLTDAKSTAESTAQLAIKLGETGSINKLDQAREQVFYAETTADLATARQAATSARERLARLMGLWDDGLDFRLPNALPALPRRPQALPSIEADAVTHRIDLQIARLDLK